jgi:hypothetical protein
MFFKALAYPWLWSGKQIRLVKQETIDDFYSPSWRPGGGGTKKDGNGYTKKTGHANLALARETHSRF